MIGLVAESMLGALLEETKGVVGVVLGTTEGELRAVVGSVADGDGGAAIAAAITSELHQIGALLGMGELGVASLKATSAARVFARQLGAVLMIELDPKRPIGELETKLRTQAWAPIDERPSAPPAPSERISAASLPPSRPSRPTPPPAPLPPNGPPVMRPIRAVPTPPPLLPPTVPVPPPLGGPPHASISSSRPNGRPSPSPTRPQPLASAAPARGSPATFPAHQMRSMGTGPVFSGDLEQFALPDLLELLRNSHRTGLLMCTTGAGIGTIQLSRGMIISADSPHALDLRDHFLSHPELDPELRQGLATLPPESFSDDRIDNTLVTSDLVPRSMLERARVARIYSAFREMMAWTVGRFSFDPAVPVVTNPALALSAQSILMQIYQEQDEQGG